MGNAPAQFATPSTLDPTLLERLSLHTLGTDYFFLCLIVVVGFISIYIDSY